MKSYRIAIKIRIINLNVKRFHFVILTEVGCPPTWLKYVVYADIDDGDVDLEPG